MHLKTHNHLKICKYCKNMIRTYKLLNMRYCVKISFFVCLFFFVFFVLNVRTAHSYTHTFLAKTTNAAGTFLKDLIYTHPVKAQTFLDLHFYHDSYEGREFVGDDIDKYLARARIYLKSHLELYERNVSGWQFLEVSNVWLEVSKYSPLLESGSVEIASLSRTQNLF